ncbi:MAG: hypothetical protein JWN14_3904, partial [Chthonomonadales bacterium]|nr:hypothetical protein [Chthonomonadales bacterium]
MPWWDIFKSDAGKTTKAENLGPLEEAVQREKRRQAGEQEDARKMRAAEDKEKARLATIEAAEPPEVRLALQDLARECLGIEIEPYTDPCMVDGWWLGTVFVDLTEWDRAAEESKVTG